MKCRPLAPLALLALATACGGSVHAAEQPAPSSPPPAAVIAVADSPPAPPSPPAAPPSTFSGTIVHPPGARVRSGPGLDQPVLDIDRVGRVETFDGWARRPDETPLPDEITGRIEAWSRDWLHLADGRGWLHSSAVRGGPPPDMPARAWSPPASPPAATAGLVETTVHLQEHPVTCEIASLLMALASRGIDTDERSLLTLTGVDRRPAEVDGGGGIQRWGDPNQVFVGDPDGHIFDRTGYGVYAGPIARAATRSGASVIASGSGLVPATIYRAILAGHPAVVWVTSDFQRTSPGTWRAWDGVQVTYAENEHAVLAVGVTPTSVLVDDPMHGQTWLTRRQFEAAYATFDDMAVVVG
jgi:uncharacterized protein YvpB